jgi:hypothetical protein
LRSSERLTIFLVVSRKLKIRKNKEPDLEKQFAGNDLHGARGIYQDFVPFVCSDARPLPWSNSTPSSCVCGGGILLMGMAAAFWNTKTFRTATVAQVRGVGGRADEGRRRRSGTRRWPRW